MPAPLDGVIEPMQASLRLHLAQAEAYQAQSQHFSRWGYPELAKTWGEYAGEERGHASKLVERLEFFDVQPNFAHDPVDWPRHDFEGILVSNYEGDETAAAVERGGFLACMAAGDAESAKIFAELLKGSEDSMANIEAIQKVLEQIGVDNYLANKTE